IRRTSSYRPGRRTDSWPTRKKRTPPRAAKYTGVSFGEDLFDLPYLARQRASEYTGPSPGHQHHIFDTDADLLFRYINARLNGDRHALFEAGIGNRGIVNIESDVMANPVGEVLTERLAFETLAVRIDVVIGDLVEALGRGLVGGHSGPNRGNG